MKILLVESDKALAQAIKAAFRDRGYTTVWVEDAKSTLHTFGKILPYFDLFVIDERGLCQELRARAPESPIILMSNPDDEEFATKCAVAESDAVCTKTVSPDYLLGLIETMVGPKLAFAN